MKKRNPFTTSGLDALAQCPKCLRTWTYDALDALLDRSNAGLTDGIHCRNCGEKARLFQSLEGLAQKK